MSNGIYKFVQINMKHLLDSSATSLQCLSSYLTEALLTFLSPCQKPGCPIQYQLQEVSFQCSVLPQQASRL